MAFKFQFELYFQSVLSHNKGISCTREHDIPLYIICKIWAHAVSHHNTGLNSQYV